MPATGVVGSVGAGAECTIIKAVLGCDVLGDSGFGIGSRADFNAVEESGDVANGVEGSGFELELLLVVVVGGVSAGVECSTAIIAVLGDDVLGGKGDGFGGPVVSFTDGVEDNANAEDGVFNG